MAQDQGAEKVSDLRGEAERVILKEIAKSVPNQSTGTKARDLAEAYALLRSGQPGAAVRVVPS